MSTIGRYEVEAEIGKGAMGVVFLATDPNLRRRVALKVHSLPQGLSPQREAEYRERFLREAQAAAGLDHPKLNRPHPSGPAAAWSVLVWENRRLWGPPRRGNPPAGRSSVEIRA